MVGLLLAFLGGRALVGWMFTFYFELWSDWVNF